MKYAPEKVFIKENDTYVEISYQEFCRKQNNEFKDKFFISLHNMLMEVDEAYYTEFYREQRREKYLRERAIEKGIFIIILLIPKNSVARISSLIPTRTWLNR